jgi:MscS family membrane protein
VKLSLLVVSPMSIWINRGKHFGTAVGLCLLSVLSLAAWSQLSLPQAPTAEVKPEVPKDTLGRDNPRGSVLGFLSAAQKNNVSIAALYLNTPLRGEAAEDLARQLALVLNRRLPARLNHLSDEPEGSHTDPVNPDRETIGSIDTYNGKLDIVLERVDRGKAGKVWLFSRMTLDAIPGVYAELSTPSIEKVLPKFLAYKIANVPLFEWVALFLGIPCLYLLTGVLDRLLGITVGTLRRRFWDKANQQNPKVLPTPLRLVVLAIVLRAILPSLGLPLLARQFWSTTALIIAIIAFMWLLILLNGFGERYLVARRPGMSGSAAVLRLVRRVVDGIVLFSGLLFTLYHFGVNPTAALAGLGVGGIAVALAAQKTLENLIAGISLIADQAVRVGDFLKIGDSAGTVIEVGLRSTRIRTVDRTLLCLPNGQISNMSLETLSARDKFWFHPVLNLRLETTPHQLRSVIAGVRELLLAHSGIETSSVRVRFLAIAASSLSVEIFAYVIAIDWNHFLEIQEELLLRIMEIIQQAGAELAFPSQTTYLAADSSDKLAQVISKLNQKSEAKRAS